MIEGSLAQMAKQQDLARLRETLSLMEKMNLDPSQMVSLKPDAWMALLRTVLRLSEQTLGA